MYKLTDKDGNVLKMRDGKAFTYSSHELAKIGKRVLEGERKLSLRIIAPR